MCHLGAGNHDAQLANIVACDLAGGGTGGVADEVAEAGIVKHVELTGGVVTVGADVTLIVKNETIKHKRYGKDRTSSKRKLNQPYLCGNSHQG